MTYTMARRAGDIAEGYMGLLLTPVVAVVSFSQLFGRSADDRIYDSLQESARITAAYAAACGAEIADGIAGLH